jgi:hypothetical protein
MAKTVKPKRIYPWKMAKINLNTEQNSTVWILGRGDDKKDLSVAGFKILKTRPRVRPLPRKRLRLALPVRRMQNAWFLLF